MPFAFLCLVQGFFESVDVGVCSPAVGVVVGFGGFVEGVEFLLLFGEFLVGEAVGVLGVSPVAAAHFAAVACGG